MLIGKMIKQKVKHLVQGSCFFNIAVTFKPYISEIVLGES
jgi:hypothetical protein